MECYICRKMVKRHKYTRHVGSHLAANDTGMMYPQQDPSLAAFSYDTANYDHHGAVFPAQSTPPRLRARTPPEHHHPLHPATSDDKPKLSSLEDMDILAQLPADSRQRAGSSPSRTPRVPHFASQQEVQPNAFHLWFKNPTHCSPKYTTIDGQKSKQDSQAQLRQDAQILRRTSREEVVRIVEEFGGLSYSDKKACLELVQKVPIFPVRQLVARP